MTTMKKIKSSYLIIFALILCVILGASVFFLNNLSKVSDLATDTTNTLITGLHYDEDAEKCEYLVIPDADFNESNFAEYKKVTGIAENAFKGNKNIKKVYIPKNITHIEKNAFGGCTSITKIYFGGSKEEWEKIEIEDGNDNIKYSTVKYDKKMPSVDD